MNEIYDRQASDRSKALIFIFLVVSLGVGIFSEMSFGRWWLGIIPLGIFTVSVAGWLWQSLVAVVFRLSPVESLRKLPVMLGQLLIATVGSYYALRAIHGWIN